MKSFTERWFSCTMLRMAADLRFLRGRCVIMFVLVLARRFRRSARMCAGGLNWFLYPRHLRELTHYYILLPGTSHTWQRT